MSTRCKPGDLAIVVRGTLNLGRVVRCQRLVPRELVQEAISASYKWPTNPPRQPGPYWEVDQDMKWNLTLNKVAVWKGEIPYFPDAYLQPLRDTDEEDETLTWAGKPVTTPVTDPVTSEGSGYA